MISDFRLRFFVLFPFPLLHVLLHIREMKRILEVMIYISKTCLHNSADLIFLQNNRRMLMKVAFLHFSYFVQFY